MDLLKLNTNRVWRTYLGGKKLDKFLSDTDTVDAHYPEEWIGSVVRAINPDSKDNEGLSTVNLQDGTNTLLDLIKLSPKEMLGESHVNKYGCDTGVLIKILDAAERLSIQVHPDKEKAKSLFNSNFGKTEAWHILEGRNIDGERPHIYLGFKEGITRELWKDKFHKQDINGMLDLMHKIYVKPGETYLIEGGMPHAIGTGCFIIEIQEPTDYTVRVERSTINGYNIPDNLCHQGLGFERMFDCFSYAGYTEDEILARWKLKSHCSSSEQCLISYDDTKCFAMDKIIVNKNCKIRDTDNFSVLLVLKGKGTLMWNDDEMVIEKGDKIFIPSYVKDIECVSDDNMELIRCFPPLDQ